MTVSPAAGSIVAELAIVPLGYVLAERGLYRLRRVKMRHRQQAFIRLTWRLFWRPLLATGWVGSMLRRSCLKTSPTFMS